MKEVRGVELWRDYPGYENHYHVDDHTTVENIAIFYLDGTNTPNMGTGYIEEGQEFQINYKFQWKVFYQNYIFKGEIKIALKINFLKNQIY